ncbi:MAG: NAD(P)-binding protein, partial [Planctomycetota bacterium]
MSNLDNDFDALVLGAGGRGLAAALRLRAAAAASTAVPPRLLVVDAAPAPGGSIRTQRTNGYVCEL